jgi:hypothetical protein
MACAHFDEMAAGRSLVVSDRNGAGRSQISKTGIAALQPVEEASKIFVSLHFTSLHFTSLDTPFDQVGNRHTHCQKLGMQKFS